MAGRAKEFQRHQKAVTQERDELKAQNSELEAKNAKLTEELDKMENGIEKLKAQNEELKANLKKVWLWALGLFASERIRLNWAVARVSRRRSDWRSSATSFVSHASAEMSPTVHGHLLIYAYLTVQIGRW
jgi:SMC interacting uncharacterized protein involved in chromosome segregation